MDFEFEVPQFKKSNWLYPFHWLERAGDTLLLKGRWLSIIAVQACASAYSTRKGIYFRTFGNYREKTLMIIRLKDGTANQKKKRGIPLDFTYPKDYTPVSGRKIKRL